MLVLHVCIVEGSQHEITLEEKSVLMMKSFTLRGINGRGCCSICQSDKLGDSRMSFFALLNGFCGAVQSLKLSGISDDAFTLNWDIKAKLLNECVLCAGNLCRVRSFWDFTAQRRIDFMWFYQRSSLCFCFLSFWFKQLKPSHVLKNRSLSRK